MGKYLMSDTDLSSLVIRAQTGDRIAYDGIVRRFQDMAVGYASALLGDFHLLRTRRRRPLSGPGLNCRACGNRRPFRGGSSGLSLCAVAAFCADGIRRRNTS